MSDWRGNLEGGDERLKPIRRSPAFRIVTWLATLTLALPIALLSPKANAQAQDVLKVIVSDIVNKNTSSGGSALGINATAAVYNELAGAGVGRFDVVSTKDVSDVAKELGIRTPSVSGQATNYSSQDLIRIAKRLQATVIAGGTVSASPQVRGRGVSVLLEVTIKDIASGENINGSSVRVTNNPRPGQSSDPEELLNKAVDDAAQKTISEIISHQLVASSILNVTGNIAILNRGIKDGLHVGDEMTVYRYTPVGDVIKVGKLKIARVYSGDSEAEIRENILGIATEDLARVIYYPKVVILNDGTFRPTASRTALSFSAIGATLSAIAIGVVLASAAKGGQASVTDVTAEPTSNGNSPAV